MREILFKGKKTDTGEWVEGDLVHDKVLGICIRERFYNPVDSATVGQYTGKHDKNGQNIFEGDILKVNIPDDFEPCEFKNVVFWDEDQCSYCVREQGLPSPDPFPLGDCDLENSVVIGNIFDNPELMA